jgi:hypothetical protein
MKDEPSLEKSEIRTGDIVDLNTVILLLEFIPVAQRDIPHTIVAIWRRTQDWVKARLDYNGIDVAPLPGPSGPDPRFVIIGNTGKYTAVMDGPPVSGVIVEEDALASVSLVQGSVLAVGILGGIYRMKDSRTWEDLTNKSIEENLSAVCAYPDGGLLVCGWGGLMVLYNGDNVERIETGTNVILTSIICDEDGEIFACGQRGVILRGTKNSLKPLDLEGVADDFWSIVKFRGDIYVCSTIALYKIVDNVSLELVRFEGEEIPTSFYHLRTYENSLMLSVGQRDALLFDGNDWMRIL